ncbi:hypothetical protein [Halobaculum sp. P14]|uniref:hypothetical protein n=1 Tax=Halobaculum sp. P14 TaxID=3421638 RepID=UPI003EC0F3BB
MPSENSPADHDDREEFPRLRDDLGEDPARFLDRDELGGPDAMMLAKARIRGIDSIATARAWIAVERALDRGPRDAVISLLENRIDDLEANGERPSREQLQAAADSIRDQHPEWDDLPERDLPCWAERVGIPAWERSDDAEQTEGDATPDAVATDGGDAE